MNTATLKMEGNILTLEGSVHFQNVALLCQQGLKYLESVETVIIDLQKLSESDSSGLAVLSAWVRAARQHNKGIQIQNMPGFMQDISKVYGLEGVLPILWEN